MPRAGHPADASQSPPSVKKSTPELPAPDVAGILSTWIAADPISLRIIEEAKKIAGSAPTVLIRGESGTGKDLLAALIHYLGPDRDQPLIKIDCATLPRELVESELFGYERGAPATEGPAKELHLAGNRDPRENCGGPPRVRAQYW